MVFQARKPQPCLAVNTALVAPSASKESTHALTFRLVGLKEETSLELQPPFGSQPCQFCAVQPGSPSWKNVAMPK